MVRGKVRCVMVKVIKVMVSAANMVAMKINGMLVGVKRKVKVTMKVMVKGVVKVTVKVIMKRIVKVILKVTVKVME